MLTTASCTPYSEKLANWVKILGNLGLTELVVMYIASLEAELGLVNFFITCMQSLQTFHMFPVLLSVQQAKMTVSVCIMCMSSDTTTMSQL